MAPSVPAPVSRATFRDPQIQERFARDGYVVLPFLDADAVAWARSVWSGRGEDGTGFVTDFEQDRPERKREVHEQITGAWSGRLDALFVDHRPFMTSFLAKWPGSGSSLYVHQDWAYVDERRFRSAVVWVALDDADPTLDNGPLQVVPGSHLVAGEHRGTRTVPWHAAHQAAVEAALITVPARAGDAVVMDNALVHASPDNRSDRVRLAVAVAVVPQEADLIHALVEPDGALATWTVDDEFFRTNTPAGLRDATPGPHPHADLEPVQTWRAPDPHAVARLLGAEPGTDAVLGGSEPPPVAGGALDRSVAKALVAHHRRLTRPDADRPFIPSATFPWLDPLVTATADLRREYLAATAARRPAPLDALAGTGLPNVGPWEAIVLRDNLGWNDEAAAACPATVRLLRSVPGLRSAMFSVLGPWARIGAHRGANKGVLRAHVGVVVPGPPDRITLWAGEERRSWAEGEAFVFDDTHEHRVANRTDGWRVSLMVEFDRPLEGLNRLRNLAVQRVVRWSPQVRGARRRQQAVRRALSA